MSIFEEAFVHFYKIAFVYKMLGQIAKSIDDFTKDIELNPKNSYSYFRRGKQYIYNQESFLRSKKNQRRLMQILQKQVKFNLKTK
ncbi:hypothetical protein FGO68_gene11896 [Halteria grandinella]|uniref:Tetratricopeptide repeat protein n=1 Tax=Halteria grandinella TaxID=5974 RepID=A0A8J8SXU9_HALGN|nr:hypothetical protein FGO68_gene11896 [Halteria grandinella]